MRIPIYLFCMETRQNENIERREEAEAIAVGGMLADAFIARVGRYPPAARRHLLLACRERLLQDNEIAKLLFEGE